MVYGIGRLDASGRIADRAITSALGWCGGDRLTLTADAGVVIARRDQGGMVTMPPRAYIAIPAALRRRCGQATGCCWPRYPATTCSPPTHSLWWIRPSPRRTGRAVIPMAVLTVGANHEADTADQGLRGPSPTRTTGPAAADRSPAITRPGNTVRSWPLLVLAAPAAAEVWSGWVGIAEQTGSDGSPRCQESGPHCISTRPSPSRSASRRTRLMRYAPGCPARTRSAHGRAAAHQIDRGALARLAEQHHREDTDR